MNARSNNSTTSRARRGAGPRSAAAVATLAIVLLGLSACGGDDDSSSNTPPPATETFAADPDVVARIPIDETAESVVRKIGAPARVEQRIGRVPRKGKKAKRVPLECYIYGVQGGPPEDHMDLCFVEGKLSSVVTVTTPEEGEAIPPPPAAPIPPASQPPSDRDRESNSGGSESS